MEDHHVNNYTAEHASWNEVQSIPADYFGVSGLFGEL